MGGKSRRGGGVSAQLIAAIQNGEASQATKPKKCGSQKERKRGVELDLISGSPKKSKNKS